MKMTILFNGKPAYKKEFPEYFFNFEDKQKAEFIYNEIYLQYPEIQIGMKGKLVKRFVFYKDGIDFILTDEDMSPRWGKFA